MGHPMSGILLGEESVQPADCSPDSEVFLPGHMRVQVCHGQHRKLVMEEVRTTLVTEDLLVRGKEVSVSTNQQYSQEDIHAHPEAQYMNLYPACNLLPTLKSICSIFYFPIAVREHSNGMFLSWVLGDNTNVSTAPNMWYDLVPTHHSLSESIPPSTPLNRRFGSWT